MSIFKGNDTQLVDPACLDEHPNPFAENIRKATRHPERSEGSPAHQEIPHCVRDDVLLWEKEASRIKNYGSFKKTTKRNYFWNVRSIPYKEIMAHGLIISLVILFFVPLYLAFIAASYDAQTLMRGSAPFFPGSQFFINLKTVLISGVPGTGGEPVFRMLINSFIMALCIAVGKIVLALLSAYSLVYFKFSAKRLVFALIFVTMMLPVEVLIAPTFQVVVSLGWLNTYAGLTLPLMASATATFLFKQFFQTIPRDLVNAAKLDGAGPRRFFWNILLPLSKTPMAAMFIILFVYGWNQYLWPLVITTDAAHTTIVMGIRYLAGVADQVPQWHYIMSVTLIALFPPVLVVISLQRWFERGLIH